MARHRYDQIFDDFKLDLPHSTELMLGIPPVAIYASAGLVAVLSILIQITVRPRLTAAVFHLLTVLLCGFLLIVYHDLMVEPMMALI